MVLGSSALGLVATVPAASAQEGTPGGSEFTVGWSDVLGRQPGEGEFKDLRIKVSQTKDLINQVIKISWTGAASTDPPGVFSKNYLQIMQCWGDDPKGPDRTQCQFGGVESVSVAGDFVASRQVSYGAVRDEKEREFTPVDYPETPDVDEGTQESAFVPFWAVGQDRPTRQALNNRNDFFDAQVTNEIPVAATNAGGEGEALFEVQTVRQAAGLGCGAPPTEGATVGRSCWLVIVPRGTTEVDGSTPPQRLNSSPLSQTNWNDRIPIKLEFLPVGQACPIGAVERPVLGHELAVDAVGRWQPALCAGGGASFAFTQLTDDLARRQQLEGSRPSLTVFTDPIPANQQLPERPVVYAPVTLSGLTIAFNIERQPPAKDAALTGMPFTEMKLTPRLVAKLLSQSYYESIAGFPTDKKHLEGNPRGLSDDKEFLAENSEYEDMDQTVRPADAIVQLGTSDSTALLWSWVVADPDAKAFLEGAPDEFGMKVNPANKGIELPASNFPRNDATCLVPDNIPFPTCTLDLHPFTNDMHEAGRAASRGDTLGRVAEGVVEGTDIIKYQRKSRQPIGGRSVLAVVDAATAARYGLQTAKLRNKAGQFVAADRQGLQAGLAAMKPSAVAGVLQPDLATGNPLAYPLTALSYAATSPSTLDAAAGKEYADFLRFAAGPGQEPGDGPGKLPAGYAPLTEPLREQTRAAAAKIEAGAGKSTEPPPAPPPAPLSPGVAAPAPNLSGPAAPNTSPPGDTSPNAAPPSDPASPTGVPQGPAPSSAAAPPAVTQKPVTGVRRTPATAIAAMGGLLVALLISGALAAGLAPVAHRLSAPKRAAPEKEVMPTGP